MLPRNPRDIAALPRPQAPEHLRRPPPVHIPPVSMAMDQMEQLSAGSPLPSYEESDTLDRDPEKLLLDEKVNMHLNNLHSQMVLAITTFTKEVEPSINSPSLMMVMSDDGEKLLDWTGPDDPGNPRNWSFGKKFFHTLIPSMFGFILTLATSIYVPCTVAVEDAFGVSRELSDLGLALYTIGFVVGPLVTAPLSELVGRYWIYAISLPVFMAFTAGAGAAQNLFTLCICRFFSSVGGSAALAIGAGTIVELWDPAKEGAIASVLFIIGMFVGAAFGMSTTLLFTFFFSFRESVTNSCSRSLDRRIRHPRQQWRLALGLLDHHHRVRARRPRRLPHERDVQETDPQQALQEGHRHEGTKKGRPALCPRLAHQHSPTPSHGDGRAARLAHLDLHRLRLRHDVLLLLLLPLHLRDGVQLQPAQHRPRLLRSPAGLPPRLRHVRLL